MKRILLGILLVASGALCQEPGQRLSNVVVVATGGTIAGTGDTSTTTTGYKPATVPVEALIQAVPELAKIARVRGEQVYQIASQNVTLGDWLKLGKRINQLVQQSDVDGIVVTHGTDTLEETAYFLNLVIKSEKPVVVVGAMRPSTALSADGALNLYDATLVAASIEALGKGVLVVMNDEIHAARDVTKSHTSDPDAFKTPDLGMLGYIQGNRVWFYRQATRRHTSSTEFSLDAVDTLPAVEIAYGYGGVSTTAIDAFARSGVAGIVYAGVGNGNPSTATEHALAGARAKSILIVRSARVDNGVVTRNNEVNDDQRDFVVSDTLNPQKARILLLLALTKTRETTEIQRMFWEY